MISHVLQHVPKHEKDEIWNIKSLKRIIVTLLFLAKLLSVKNKILQTSWYKKPQESDFGSNKYDNFK